MENKPDIIVTVFGGVVSGIFAVSDKGKLVIVDILDYDNQKELEILVDENQASDSEILGYQYNLELEKLVDSQL